MKRVRPGLSGREHWDGDAAGLLVSEQGQPAQEGPGPRMPALRICSSLELTVDREENKASVSSAGSYKTPNAGRRPKTQLCTDWAVK